MNLTIVPDQHDGRVMVRPMKSPRERAARALCQLAGHPPDIRFEGAPMWRSFLAEADAVLQAALAPEQWAEIRSLGPDDDKV